MYDSEGANKLEDLLQKVQEFLDTAVFKFNDNLDESYASYEILDHVYQPSEILKKTDIYLYKLQFYRYRKGYIDTFLVELENIKFNKKCEKCQQLKKDTLEVLNSVLNL